MKTFSEFIYSKYPSYSHGHEWHHMEVDGLYYRMSDYNDAVEAYDEYQFKQHLKGVKREKSNELARRKQQRVSCN